MPGTRVRGYVGLILAAVCVLGALGLVLSDERVDKPPSSPGFPELSIDGDGPADLWAVGDGANGRFAAKQLARRIVTDGPDRVLYLGDVYERGTREDFRDNFETVYG